MSVDNLFIVESPLQALVALELNLKFGEDNNGILYRVFGEGRELNDSQTEQVVKLGDWAFSEAIHLDRTDGLPGCLKVRKLINELSDRFSGRVGRLFFGEFRAQWMQLARLAIAPKEAVLIDDGAATLTAKRKYIDHKIYYPETAWPSRDKLRQLAKNIVLSGLFDKKLVEQPVMLASAFLGQRSDYQVDFSEVKARFGGVGSGLSGSRKVFFFGSKYSETDIVSLKYELEFISKVKDFYEQECLEIIYCAHRDESNHKLEAISRILGVNVVRPEFPAELFMIERHHDVAEIAAAYSSVLNNLKLIFPEKVVRSFRLHHGEINIKNREDVEEIYRHYLLRGIKVQPEF